MENLSEPAETIAVPLLIPVPAYLRDHAIGGLAVLPAVEALQIVARSRPDGLDGHSCRQERAFFHHPLTIDPAVKEIAAVCGHARFADGRCFTRLTTLRSGRRVKWTRPLEHLSVWFMPAGQEAMGGDAPEGTLPFCCETVSPADPGDFASHAGPALRVSADRLYDELVPFGPAYRNLRGDIFLAEASISATVSGGDFPGAVGPLGSPFPLDAAMHAACAWGQRYRNRIVFPVGFDRREIHSPTRAGETYLCRITPLRDEGAALRFDVRLQDRQGRPVETVFGLTMREGFGGKRTPPAWVREGLVGCG